MTNYSELSKLLIAGKLVVAIWIEDSTKSIHELDFCSGISSTQLLMMI